MKYDPRYKPETRAAYLEVRDQLRNMLSDSFRHISVERYRITRNGEVHFYGRMPNSNSRGWYLEANHWSDFVSWSGPGDGRQH